MRPHDVIVSFLFLSCLSLTYAAICMALRLVAAPWWFRRSQKRAGTFALLLCLVFHSFLSFCRYARPLFITWYMLCVMVYVWGESRRLGKIDAMPPTLVSGLCCPSLAVGLLFVA